MLAIVFLLVARVLWFVARVLGRLLRCYYVVPEVVLVCC